LIPAINNRVCDLGVPQNEHLTSSLPVVFSFFAIACKVNQK